MLNFIAYVVGTIGICLGIVIFGVDQDCFEMFVGSYSVITVESRSGTAAFIGLTT